MEPLPALINYCWGWRCDANTGNVTTDRGSSVCTPSTDKCVINYCNSTKLATGGLTGTIFKKTHQKQNLIKIKQNKIRILCQYQ
jgi:hypothetical protein